MDVRCESCQTVYEFDDARVKDSGVTVKCTQCGHIFKVRKKSSEPPSRTLPGIPSVHAVEAGVQYEPAPPPPPVPPPAEAAPATIIDNAAERTWMLRTPGSGEVRRFRDLTTLQQWIVEMKAARDDEISRNGDRWKRIGGIAELEPFFRIVEAAQAARAAGVPMQSAPITREGDDLAWQSPVPQRPAPPPPEPADDGVVELDDNALQAWRVTASGQAADAQGDGEEELEIPRRRLTGTQVVATLAVLVIAGLAGYLALYKREALRSIVASDGSARANQALRKGREYFLLDTDEDFHHAEQEFQRALGADNSNPQAVSALVELNATWARHLRDDASLEEKLAAGAPSAGRDDLRRQAQVRLDDARRYATEAKSLAPADPGVNRALADLLVLDGAPELQVEQALRLAESRRSDDPEARYVRAALLMREARLDEARALLEEANRLNQLQTQHDLLRADYLLALLHAQAGRRDEAKAMARRMLEANPHHRRAAALAAWMDSAPMPPGAAAASLGGAAPAVREHSVAGPPAAAPPAAPSAPAPTPPAAPVPAPAPVAATPLPLRAPTAAGAPPRPTESKEPQGYEALVAAGNKLLERGRGKDAVKLFEKALVENPGGLEATSGLGWALLDTEHYNAAADKFREVLAEVPNNGEALIGLAETYKMRGDKKRALEYFKKYLAELPGGSKAAMAHENVREIEDALNQQERPTPTEIHEPPPPPLPPSP